MHDELSEQAVLKTLNPHQNTTITTIAEMIIPQTNTPGAKAARVNEFIDLILTDWFDDRREIEFYDGLEDVDSRAQDLFGKDFVSAGQKQQAQLLQALEEEMVAHSRM